ncbi:DUF2235 domain-containing protein [Alterinioella nitratireducens]|jgi:uncharacterized protein (DUF2235 family)|uniref:DUF2235 domain-containing protein n=1 Tax=Alterinioella nitratireducens TaxID=2735915 RepID=UPI000C57FEE2|nr:hypothetical protein [Nioella sp.]
MAARGGFLTRLRGFRSRPEPRLADTRAARTHVVLLDGTMSSLKRGYETNIGLTYRLLSEVGPAANLMVYYEPGIQWRGLKRSVEVIAGIGINRQIKRSYLFLARNYRPGDRIFLMGYSRGAFAVRSLAGLIDKLGLMRPAQITEETMARLYDLYEREPDGASARAFRETRCHPRVEITMVGVYDCVRALGVRWPVLWRLAPQAHEFHNHRLGPATQKGSHALALEETRDAYAPLLWDVPPEREGDIVQMWFRGTHGDVGGNLGDWHAARPLSNIPLVWMLERAEAAGLVLPPHWRGRYLTDPGVPSAGNLRGWGLLFPLRHRRKPGRDPSERVHPTAAALLRGWGYAVDAEGRIGPQ